MRKTTVQNQAQKVPSTAGVCKRMTETLLAAGCQQNSLSITEEKKKKKKKKSKKKKSKKHSEDSELESDSEGKTITTTIKANLCAHCGRFSSISW